MSDTATTARIPGLIPGVWTVDNSHSTVGFVARHVVVAKTRGKFTDYSGTITVAENLVDSKVEATVQLASVQTGDEKRDEHLRSADFFDVANHPTMTFVSTSITPDGDDYKLAGDLTIRGVTKPVEFELEFEGVAGDPWGGTRAGFNATTEINRKDWGLEWNVALETGGFLVSDKIKIELEIEAVAPQPQA
jgi:polyisoprenoid-binding protein YceI